MAVEMFISVSGDMEGWSKDATTIANGELKGLEKWHHIYTLPRFLFACLCMFYDHNHSMQA